MDNDSLPTPSQEPVPAAAQLLAPWWHTVAVLAMLATWALLGGRRTHNYAATPHALTYISQILITWMMFGTIICGIYDRRHFFFTTLLRRAHSLWKDALQGAAVYIGIYISIVFIAMLIGIGVVASRLLHPAVPSASTTQTQSARPDAPLPPPVPVDPEAPFKLGQSKLHFNSKAVMALAPRTAFELLLWVLVSFTAGFCEEHIFRGYLLHQFLAMMRPVRLSSRLVTIVCVAVTSLIFGSLHLYEGVGGAAIITLLGAAYAVISLKLGNLRAVIVAHFLQDLVAGVALFTIHRLHVL